MAFVIPPVDKQKFLPKLVPMSPYQIYLAQVTGVMEGIRFSRKSMDYLPPQMGGIEGQRQVTAEALVLQMITFEVD